MLVTCPLTNSGDSISPAVYTIKSFCRGTGLLNNVLLYRTINDVPLLNNTIQSGCLMGEKAIWLDIAQVSDRIL